MFVIVVGIKKKDCLKLTYRSTQHTNTQQLILPINILFLSGHRYYYHQLIPGNKSLKTSENPHTKLNIINFISRTICQGGYNWLNGNLASQSLAKGVPREISPLQSDVIHNKRHSWQTARSGEGWVGVPEYHIKVSLFGILARSTMGTTRIANAQWW